MRVYELAKEAGVSCADVLAAAGENGVDAATSISSLNKCDVETLRKAIKEAGYASVEEKRKAKRARARELAAATLREDGEKLSRHLEAAIEADKANAGREALPRPPSPKAKPTPRAQAKPVAPQSEPKPGAPVAAAPKAPAPQAPSAGVVPKLNLRINPKKPTGPSFQAPKFSISVSTSKPGASKPHPGFKPLQKAPSGSTAIKITVAAPPKQKVQRPVGDYDDADRANRKSKKSKDALKAFEKRSIKQNSNSSKASEIATPVSKDISIRGAVVVKDLAAKLGVKPNRLIADLMALKILASINQRVEPEVAIKIADKYGFSVTVEKARDKSTAKPVLKAIDADDLIPEDPAETLKPRAPVVTFLGHVDHGKTTLMDYIRKARVAAGEAGGITQKISAYQVDVAGRKITFIDTPGHAAFSAMRARGAQITDIAVLIIAADDGIMPQTEECIKVARQTGVQIMVAITKADKPTANVDRVMQQLQKRGLTPESWGGDIITVPVSGVTGMGVDTLLENILVQAEVLELVANPDRRANGYVIESELQQGLGPCATLLVTGGTLKVGDAILIGEHFGRVRALIDDCGRRIKEAGPAMPVKATGLSGVPEAGSEFRVMLDEQRAKTLAEQTREERRQQELSSAKASSVDALLRRMAAEGHLELNVIVKADTQGSVEAIVEMLHGIKSEKVGLNVIGMGTGNVSLTDVKSAAAGRSIIVGFDVGCDSGVQQQARHDGVRINSFRIIYELSDYVKQSMLDLLPPEYKEVVKGHAEIKAIYDISKLGKIAGSQMLDGSLVAKEKFRIFRDGRQIWDGKVKTLRHFKDEVKEVTGQQECGVCFAGFEDFKAGDTIECYLLEELPRTL